MKTLGEVLYYEVDQILVVLPSETESLTIREGEDLCTLVTCTPYGVNTHRLLVRGHRIDAPVELTDEPSCVLIRFELLYVMIAIVIWILFVLGGILLAVRRKNGGGGRSKPSRRKRARRLKEKDDRLDDTA